jgi:ATP-dependent Clp protease ATP-binding subunit ClpC
MALERLSPDAHEVLAAAHQRALQTSGGEVTLAHLLIGLHITDSVAARTLDEYGITTAALEALLANSEGATLFDQDAPRAASAGELRLDADTASALRAANQLSRTGDTSIDPGLLCMGALAVRSSQVDAMLRHVGSSRQEIMNDLGQRIRSSNNPPTTTPPTPSSIKRKPAKNKTPAPAPRLRNKAVTNPSTQSRHPLLDTIGINLTERARNAELDLVVGRDNEILRTIGVLCRRTKANPVLVGDAGVGKTAVVEGLAQRIANESVPEPLINHELYSIDLAALVAGTTYRGDFEKKFKALVNEVTTAGNILLFIDEIHSVIGAGAGFGASNAAELLKPFIARGELRLIGATTRDEYKKYIEADPALERRFTAVEVKEPTLEVALAMVRAIAPSYERYHGVRFTPEALKASVTLSDRYIADRRLPDKAIDLLDESAAAYQLAVGKLEDAPRAVHAGIAESLRQGQVPAPSADGLDFTTVSASDIATVVANWTNIPVELANGDAERLCDAEAVLGLSVVGQRHAIDSVARSLRRRRSGVLVSTRPSSFLAVGPSGVGKTHLAKATANFLFGSDDDLIRIDMSEYMEEHSIARLIGAPPGYVGHNEPGQLTEAVRRRPHSVVLFDEIDKAHPRVLDILLQVLEDGVLTDSAGRRVSFANTVIFLTANPPSVQKRGNSFGLSQTTTNDREARRLASIKELKKIYRPEFLNRIDEVLVFDELTLPERIEIVKLNLFGLEAQLATQNHALVADADALVVLASKDYDPDYGARPLRRAIQAHVIDPIADLLLGGGARPGDVIAVVGNIATGSIAIESVPVEMSLIPEPASA